jgi:polyhydroxybutyrate depolymerase
MPCTSGGWSPGDQRITLTHGGIEREYEVHLPPSYTGTTRVPLVMTIHGAHNTIAMVKGWSKMNPVADANGFIVVYPQAVDCWNAGFTIGGCEAAPDDVGFLKAVVAEVESHACIDPKQVYATGISNGSMMSQYLACEASDVFAAVAGVAGGAQCRNTVPRPVPLFYVHGTEDKTIGYSGAQRTADAWVMRDGCSTTPMETYNMGSTKCVTYGACREGAEVVFCTVTGMGHCWPEDSNCGPGGGAAYGVTDFKASPMMWEFFKRHPLP